VKPGIAVTPTKASMGGDRIGVAQLAPEAPKTLVATRASPAAHSQR